MSSDKKHALVFGASGISGWSILNQALSYPTPTTFDQITGLTNRPLSIEDAGLPPDPRLQLANGVDLTGSVESVVSSLREKVKNVETTTHVFFTAYIAAGDFGAVKKINTSILDVAIRAVEQLAPKLRSVILQTGSKGYGVEFPDKVTITAPLREDYPRIPKPYYENILYYSQVDLLTSLSKGKPWTFSEIRPNVIVGFVPGTNFMNAAQGLGLYLSLYRAVHGEGAHVPFPGSQGGWKCKHSDTFQDILAKMEIYAALNIDKCGDGSAFNAADGEVTTWSQKWPGLCEYFGLVGEGPGEKYEPLGEFAKKNQGVWDGVVERHGLKTGRLESYGWPFLYFIMDKIDFDRQYDLSKARSVGFKETIDTVKGYTIAFDRMRAAKVIP
jgi:hypothetical protein